MPTVNKPEEQAAESTETVEQTTTEEVPPEREPEAQSSAEKEADTQKEQSFNKESLLGDLHKERDRRKAYQAQVEQLTAQTEKLKTTTSQLTAVQRKYDRLEQFLSNLDGPIGRALDSKQFSSQLFETDTPIKEIVETWVKANPSITSKALGSSATPSASDKSNIGDLLRQALKAAR